ncbi:hypothetical protein [Phyllobacterium lublinensis]|uniref:COG3904 family protein n=1 Tax=Phyllobacterium lublinensis TaxID=2875708 RepID=UPI001CCCB99A|nr:hypothetical protein [Phyllobacterium sp. 2063]MBZ9653528.1 hypothetical protein [Phyllobacterium sp. 2063]
MQFEYTDPQTEIEQMFGGHFSINVIGFIEPGDDIKFQEFLARVAPPPRTDIYINSSGGDVETAINIGRIIRGAWFSTNVGSYVLDHDKNSQYFVARKLLPGQCMSAATLIFLGGKLRYFNSGSKFGVHQFSFRDPKPDHIGLSQVLSAKIARYISDMGISPDFLDLSTSAGSDAIKLVNEDELERIGIVTGGETDVTWSIQGRNKILYVRGERDSLYGHHKVMLGYVRDEGFYFHAVIEAQGRETELTEFPLVEIVVNGEESKIDISNRSARSVVGIYVNVFAKLDKQEAQLIANSNSFGVQIRGSSEAEMFLGIRAMNTEGGKDQLQSFNYVLQ